MINKKPFSCNKGGKNLYLRRINFVIKPNSKSKIYVKKHWTYQTDHRTCC